MESNEVSGKVGVNRPESITDTVRHALSFNHRRSNHGILTALNEKSYKKILIIRHSATEGVVSNNNSILNRIVPQVAPSGFETPHQLSSKGVRMALDFGRAIRNMYPDSKLSLYHSQATRCKMTANYISEGQEPNNQNLITPMVSLGLGIKDQARYAELRAKYTHLRSLEGQYQFIEFNKRWVAGEFSEALIDSRQYANAILGKMLGLEDTTDKSITIFVGHDMTLYPLIGHLFGIGSICPINYLEGMSFLFKNDSVDVRFKDVKKSINVDDLIV